MPILEGNYTASELETIATHALVRDGYLPDNSGFLLVPENVAGLSKRNTNNDKVFICQIYQKADSKKNRRIALFAAVTDLNSPITLPFQRNNIPEKETLSTLVGILKNYKDSQLQADELIIPIMLCRNRHDNHWSFLHIKKTNNDYTAVLFDPASEISTSSAKGINYIESQIRSTFNCILVHAPLRQQPKPKLYATEKNSGVYTAENIISIIHGKTPHSKVSRSEESLRKEHFELHNKKLFSVRPPEQLDKPASWGEYEESSSSASPNSADSLSEGSSSESESSAKSRTKTKLYDKYSNSASHGSTGSSSDNDSVHASQKEAPSSFGKSSSTIRWGSHTQILTAVVDSGKAAGQATSQAAQISTTEDDPIVLDQPAPGDNKSEVCAEDNKKDEATVPDLVIPPRSDEAEVRAGDGNKAEAAVSSNSPIAAQLEAIEANNEKTALDYLKEIQQTIRDKKEWETKLGGKDVYFYKWTKIQMIRTKKLRFL